MSRRLRVLLAVVGMLLALAGGALFGSARAPNPRTLVIATTAPGTLVSP